MIHVLLLKFDVEFIKWCKGRCKYAFCALFVPKVN